jgi:hypothetical protein
MNGATEPSVRDHIRTLMGLGRSAIGLDTFATGDRNILDAVRTRVGNAT